jgi:methionyl-tRNA formyltransferase
VERIVASGAELAIVCAFGQLLRAPLLGRLELLNVHPSLLPRWRGAAPIERAIMAGDAETGVTILRGRRSSWSASCGR